MSYPIYAKKPEGHGKMKTSARHLLSIVAFSILEPVALRPSVAHAQELRFRSGDDLEAGGKKKPYLLTISAEGNPKLRQIADLMVERAPELGEWEFCSSRPARPAPGAVQLPESEERFETSQSEFVPVEQPERGRLDLVVVDDQLAGADRESARRAVSLYLDQLLGEDTVELWIDRFSVESRLAAHGKKSVKMAELSDYLLWVTHRETNPVRSPADRLQ
jgi:hypothetical protein